MSTLNLSEPISDLPLAQEEEKDFSVSEISKQIQTILEKKYTKIRVKGELTGVKYHSSGHLYYSIKDETATLDGICWKGIASKLAIDLKDGMEVVVKGKISSFILKSKYLILAEEITESGIGDLQKKFEEIKQRLEKEGLFDAGHKKPIPKMPGTIGIITSPTGAVIQDLINRFKERYCEKVLLWPSSVQGEESARQLIKAIQGFNEIDTNIHPKPDVIILARGGGSIEDLWVFNNENLIRAIFDSKIPVISAIGHETDHTLCDFVADHRSSTPTAAGEISCPKKTDIHNYLNTRFTTLYQMIVKQIDRRENFLKIIYLQDPKKIYQEKIFILNDLSSRLSHGVEKMFHVKHNIVFNQDLFLQSIYNRTNIYEDKLNFIHKRTRELLGNIFLKYDNELKNLDQIRQAYSLQKTLDRGFAIVKDEDGKVISSVKVFTRSPKKRIIFQDGEVFLS
jgi:exodeoxyribonuclease VII large subunit